MITDFTSEELAVFTHSERTIKKYTLEDVKAAARALVKPGVGICNDAISKLQGDDTIRFTAVEVTRLAEKIAFDSEFYH